MVDRDQVQKIKSEIQSQNDSSTSQVTPETEALLFLASNKWCPKSLATTYRKSYDQLSNVLAKQLYLDNLGDQMAQIIKIMHPELVPAAEEFGQKIGEFCRKEENKNLSDDEFRNKYEIESREISKNIARKHHLKEHYDLEQKLTDEQKISMKKWMKEYKDYISPGEDAKTLAMLRTIRYNGYLSKR